MSKSYEVKPLPKKQRWEADTYLSGLYTSTYKDVLYLHFFCPLCGDTIVQTHHIANGSVDYEKEVAGLMVNQMRQLLADHYKDECGSDRERRQRTAEILIDKKMGGAYR